MIKEIRIKGFRTCKSVRVIFKSPIMALIGKNAVGKTNTLKAIDLASEYAFMGVTSERDTYSKKAAKSTTFVFERKKQRLSYTLNFRGKKEVYIRDSLSVTTNDEEISVFHKKSKYQLKLLGQEKPIFIPANYSGLRFLYDISQSSESKPDAVREALRYSSAMIYILLELAHVRYHAVQDQPALEYITIEEFEEWKDAYKAEGPNKRFSCQYYDFYRNRKDEFGEYKSLLVSLGLIDDLKLYELGSKEDEPTGAEAIILWMFIVDGRNVFYGWLSDGTKRIIQLLFHMFYDRSSLMLIEEPESSIHWGLLANLLGILHQYCDNRRILISTHSEQILNQLIPEQLIYLYKDKGHTKVKYVTSRSLPRIKNFLTEIGPLGEYATSGALEEILDD